MNLLPLVSSVSWPLAPVVICSSLGMVSSGVKVRPALAALHHAQGRTCVAVTHVSRSAIDSLLAVMSDKCKQELMVEKLLFHNSIDVSSGAQTCKCTSGRSARCWT